MKIWVKTESHSEGKYLVVRRDGTIPKWPHFVLGGDDPSAPAALLAYADDAEKRALEPDYVESIRELAAEYEHRSRLAEQVRRSERGEKLADPDAPPHRKDNPAIIGLMRGEGDLSAYMPSPAGGGWRPIESAPKGDGDDGPDILLYGPRENRSGRPLFYIENSHWYRTHWTIVWMDGYGDPTHWRPLPAPPSLPGTKP